MLAIVDHARTAEHEQLRKLLADADFLRGLDPFAITALIGQGRPGTAAVHDALHAYEPRLARSRRELERRFLARAGAGRGAGLVPYTWDLITNEPGAVAAELIRMLGSDPARQGPTAER